MQKLYFKGKHALTEAKGAGSYGYFGFTWRDTVALLVYFIGQIVASIVIMIIALVPAMSQGNRNITEVLESLAQNQMVLFLPFVPIALILFLLFRKELQHDIQDFWQNKWRIIGTTCAIWLFGIVVLFGYEMIITQLFGVGDQVNENQATLNAAIGQNIWVFILFVVIIVPFIEEVIFRKVLFTHFGNCVNYIISGVFSVLIFTFIHITTEVFSGQWFVLLTAFPSYFVIALVVTFSNYIHKNFFGGYLAHVIHNGMVSIMMILPYLIK